MRAHSFGSGGTMYDMMIEIITSDPYQALALFLRTLTIAGVLALGILIIETLTTLFYSCLRKGKNYAKNHKRTIR